VLLVRKGTKEALSGRGFLKKMREQLVDERHLRILGTQGRRRRRALSFNCSQAVGLYVASSLPDLPPVSVDAPILRTHAAVGAGPASSAVVLTSRPRRQHAAAMKSRATLDARRPAGKEGEEGEEVGGRCCLAPDGRNRWQSVDVGTRSE
jgi:hypothetical protein